jgi:hypothetical protein
MNKILLKIFITLCSFIVGLFAFEDVFSRQIDFKKGFEERYNTAHLSYSPASILYTENIEIISICSAFSENLYKRTYDPSAVQDILARYYTLRQINETSFFAAGISYNDLRLRDMYGSREKDFYDDYFSMVDSSAGTTAYYGPQLELLYNVEIAKDLYFGIMGNYGVERGLKDTFPETITIMRNSSYRTGFDYRKPSFALGVFARYYDDQSFYESVKSYTEVIPKTFIGYHVFYNENATSTSKKKRTRNGFEAGANLRLGGQGNTVLNVSGSALHRISRSEIYSAYSKPRGLWQRQGFQILSELTQTINEDIKTRLYFEHLQYSDWGKSLISNALVLENEEKYTHLGAMMQYKPTVTQKAYLGAEIGKVSYDYIEYVFPFEDARSGVEWNILTGADIMLSSVTSLSFDLEYGKEVPRFYWETNSFQNTEIGIKLEQLFSFGYIALKFENFNKKPENNIETIRKYVFNLEYRRK